MSTGDISLPASRETPGDAGVWRRTAPRSLCNRSFLRRRNRLHGPARFTSQYGIPLHRPSSKEPPPALPDNPRSAADSPARSKKHRRQNRRRQRKWTPESVLAAIRKRHRQRLTLRPSFVRKQDARLFEAGRNHFRTWKNAVEKAGFPYEDCLRGQWTRAKTIRALQAYVRLKKVLVAHELKAHNRQLFNAVRNHFASLAAAALERQLPYRRANVRWSREKVLDALRRRKRRGLCITNKAVKADDVPLYGAVLYYFDRYSFALKILETGAAGEDSPGTKKRTESAADTDRPQRHKRKNKS